MDLSIIIVSWNIAPLLAACLDSIDRALRDLPAQVEIIVVDSASSDNTVALLTTSYPQVKLAAQTNNVGFSRANNIGLQMAQGRYLFLLNPDTEILDDCLTQMLTYLEQHPAVGIIGPRTLNTDGSTQSTRRRFPRLATGFFESTWLHPLAPPALLQHYYVTDQADDAVVEVDWVQGSALMTRHEVYEQIGGLDEAYFMFSEELDWCRRARDAGWRTFYLGTARIIHHGGKSTDQVIAQRHIYFQESKLRYFRKFHGPTSARFLRLVLLTLYALQLLVEALKGLLGHKRALRRERVAQYWQVLRSGLKVP